ncbi:hypothetical protein GYH30_044599 [Glycine max]|nr:hypothetical protein GYH30_044599 [Glycine max]
MHVFALSASASLRAKHAFGLDLMLNPQFFFIILVAFCF